MGARRLLWNRFYCGPAALIALALAGVLAWTGGCDREDNDWGAFDPEQRELVVLADTLRVSEGGAEATFRVALRMVPEDTVTVLIRPQSDQIVAEPDSLVLVPVLDQWAGERRIVVRALDDQRAEGPHSEWIDVHAFSRDPAYNGQGGDGLVPVLIADDDQAGVSVNETLLTLVESLAGTVNQTYEVALLSEPADTVRIAIASTPIEPTLHIEPAELVFSPANWDTVQRVTLWAEMDEVDGDDLDLQIGHVASSSDPDYDAQMQIADVRLLVLDSTLSPVGRLEFVLDDDHTLHENDAAQTVRVVITLSRPSTENVVVHLSTVNGSAVGGQDFEVLDEDITFAPGEALVQTREINVVNDDILEFPEQFEVAITPVENLFVGELDRLTLDIDDDDTTPLTMTVTDAEEDSGAAEFIVSMPTTQMVPISFRFVTEGGTALQGNDYEALDEEFVIEQGQTHQIVPVVLLADPDHEPDEDFTARLVDLSRHATWSQAPVACTILNDDPQTVTLTGGDYEESDSHAIFTVRTEAPYNEDVSLLLNALSGDGLGNIGDQEDAEAGSDFGAMVGALIALPAGETEMQVRVPILQDPYAERLQEYFRLEIAGADQDGFAGLIATASIRDDDQPCLQVDDLLVDESDGTANFRVEVIDGSGALTTSTADIVFDAFTMDQTAEAGQDYEAYASTLTINAGQSGLDIPVTLLDDGQDDDSESFVLVLGPPENATGACRDENAFCRIADDEYPSLNLYAVAADRYNEGSVYEYVARISTPRQEPTTFIMNLSAGSSNGQGVDYDFAENGLQTILPGDTEMHFSASFLDDQLAGELDETLDISVGGANVALGIYQIQAVIIDAPELSITGDAVNEGETAHFTVTLDATSTADVQFLVQYASDTATAGSDFSNTNVGPFTIPAGSLSADVAVPVTAGDGGDASVEYFVATLITPTNATLSPFNSAIGTIYDMDPPELRWDGPASAVEGTDVELLVRLSWPSEVDVEFEVSFTDGTAARSGIDYDDSNTGPYTVAAGMTSFIVPVPTVADGLPELASEDFTVTLHSPVEAVLGTPVIATGNVLDADQPELSIPVDETTTEGGDLFFTVHLSQATIVPVFFGLEYDVGSTQGPTDFDASNTGPFSMMPGTTDTTITVITFDDTDFENQEAFIVRIASDPTNAVVGDPFEATGTIDDND